MEYSARVKTKAPSGTKSESILMVGKWMGAYTTERVRSMWNKPVTAYLYMRARHCTASRIGDAWLDQSPTTAKDDR